MIISPMLETTYLQQSPAMPVDFTAYLLSSSPPGTGLEYLSSHMFLDRPSTKRNLSSFSQSPQPTITTSLPQTLYEKRKPNSSNQLKPIIACTAEPVAYQPPKQAGISPLNSPTSPSKIKKKVSFADYKGLALATVRVMTEPSDVPPRLQPEILLYLTQGAKAAVSEHPPLMLNFSQPAADYLAFRDRLEKECVSLENVILKDYTVMGTVKVKNLHFEKRVFIRCTSDSWASQADLPASFAQNQTDSRNRLQYDTFTFEMSVPTDFDRDRKIEFAVCYVVNNTEYWDNNCGKNYRILSTDYRSKHERNRQLLDSFDNMNLDSWTSYACWNHADKSVPYW